MIRVPTGGDDGSGNEPGGEPTNKGGLKDVNVNYNKAIHEFADAARHYFKDAAKANTEGTKADGGYTVPDDIRTEINRYREENFSLQSLVDTETVTTESEGVVPTSPEPTTKALQKFLKVPKLLVLPDQASEVVKYTIKKYAGWLPVTNELLADSDANIANTLIRWLGEQDIATRSRLILNIMKSKSATELANLDGIEAYQCDSWFCL